MMKRVLGLLLLSAVAAQAQGKPDLVVPGSLTYGVAATFAPFEFQQNGTLIGLDIDLIDAMAKKMSVTPAPLSMDFAGLIPALLGKRIDVINSGMYINAKRAEQVEFVPYMKIGNEIVVRKGNPLHIKSRADLCGYKIAVTLGGIEETYAREDVEACKKAGKAEPTVITLPTAQNSAVALQQGRADAVFNSSPGAAIMVSSAPDAFDIVTGAFASTTQVGFAVRKGETPLAEALGAALKSVVADGDYQKILVKYNLGDGSIF